VAFIKASPENFSESLMVVNHDKGAGNTPIKNTSPSVKLPRKLPRCEEGKQVLWLTCFCVDVGDFDGWPLAARKFGGGFCRHGAIKLFPA